MSFEELKQLWVTYAEAKRDHDRLAANGRGSSCEDAGMRLFEAERDFQIAYASADADARTALDEHIRLETKAA